MLLKQGKFEAKTECAFQNGLNNKNPNFMHNTAWFFCNVNAIGGVD